MTNNHPFQLDSFFVLRTPALPFGFLERWSDGLSASISDPEHLEASLRKDKEMLRRRLMESVCRLDIREALFLASPDLEEQLEPWLQGTLLDEKLARIDHSLVRYLVRMASRSTPFGLFAGCSLGRWEESSNLSTRGWDSAIRHTRLDMGYLCSLVEALEKDPIVRKVLVYRPNSSLYTVAGRIRYAECCTTGKKGRAYQLVAMDKVDYLEATLKRAAHGASIEHLASALVNERIQLDEAETYILGLIDNQVLVSNIYPRVTDKEPINTIIMHLSSHPETEHWGAQLDNIRNSLSDLDTRGVGNHLVHYKSLFKELETLPRAEKTKEFIQTDLFNLVPSATLGPEVHKATEDAIALVRRLIFNGNRDPFKAFKMAFSERYGSQWVPLLEVLDGEVGIGTMLESAPADTSPLIEGLPFHTKTHANNFGFDQRDAFMLRRVLALQDKDEWELSDKDIKILETHEPDNTPDSFQSMAIIFASNHEALNSGDFYIYLNGFYGPSGIRLLGRFCYMDPRLEVRAKTHLEAEARFAPEAIYAEVVHLPEGKSRVGNLLCRPPLRDFEIPFLGASSVPGDNQIPLQDLLVSVVNDRVILRSIRLEKEVIPRLSSAHNFSQGVSIYTFLCLLQEQGSVGGLWSWGGALESLPFLPRVRRGRHILSRARWRIDEDELKPILNAKGNAAFRALQELRDTRKLPRHVVFSDDGQEFLVDLDNILWVETFFRAAVKHSFVILYESLYHHESMKINNSDEQYLQEVVIPAIRVPTKPPIEGIVPPSGMLSPSTFTSVPRTFALGSEWLYLKIYTGSTTADELLVKVLRPFLNNTHGLWDRWFFIRYSDPDDHIRLRFHGDPDILIKNLLPQFHQVFDAQLKANRCWKIQADTYEREIERYGGDTGIVLSEELFWIDSEIILELLRHNPGSDGAERRWRLGLKSVDMLLRDLCFDLETRTRIVQNARQAFSQEFSSKGNLDIQLGKKYRSLQKELNSLVLDENTQNGFLHDGINILRNRSQRLVCWFDKMKSEMRKRHIHESSQEVLVSSYIHMHLNRLFRSDQRRHEFVIYDFLGRIYASQLARLSRATNSSNPNN